MSQKQGMNLMSSLEANATDDVVSSMLWARLFLEMQGECHTAENQSHEFDYSIVSCKSIKMKAR
jgi:hypothetical protein